MKRLLLVFLTCCTYTFSKAQIDTSGFFTSFDNAKIFYRVKGAGKPIILLHGFTNSSLSWKNKPVVDSLVNNGFKVVMIDLRGNGNSDKPGGSEGYANDAEAKDVIGLMKFLHFKQYDALGYSRGSIILARVMVKDNHCKRGIMGGMGADFTNPEWPRRIGFYKALMNDTIPGYDEFRKYIAREKLDPKTLAWQQKEQPSTSKEALGKLKQHVLVICGKDDSDNGNAVELQKLIPNATFVTVPGTHNNAAGTPEFATAIVTFLKK